MILPRGERDEAGNWPSREAAVKANSPLRPLRRSARRDNNDHQLLVPNDWQKPREETAESLSSLQETAACVESTQREKVRAAVLIA